LEEEGVEFGSIGLIFGQIFQRENCFHRALWDTGAAVNTGLRIDIVPRPFIFRLTRDNALYWANFHAGTIADAQIKDYVCHLNRTSSE